MAAIAGRRSVQRTCLFTSLSESRQISGAVFIDVEKSLFTLWRKMRRDEAKQHEMKSKDEKDERRKMR